MYPHERSLVKRLEGQPFALIGINSDGREAAKKAIEKEHLSWRHYWDGGNMSGPIASRWNIQGWPTLYIIDAKGVIRHKFVGSPGGEKLDEIIDGLLKEMKGGKKKDKP